MMNKSLATLPALAIAATIAVLAITSPPPADACGGFFCTNVPVDQNAERIIFTQNRDATISAYVQIEYTGAAPDFSWILPLPHAIDAEAIEVPEDAMDAFQELEIATDPVFIPPTTPECVPELSDHWSLSSTSDAVDVFASGEVGPYGFDVVGSDEPEALVAWLRDNGYQVTDDMTPIINLYVEEEFAFLAMKLRPSQGVQDIEPVKVTYRSERPMIPLRLTAVAANPNMAVMVWIFADRQATPINYASMTIANDELIFFGRGASNNYRQLMSDKADQYGGQAFITEYAAPSRELTVVNPLLQHLRDRYPYVTRLNTVISPEEMTVDPVFDYDPQLKDVSNIHDLRGMTGLFECERAAPDKIQTSSEVAPDEAATAPPKVTSDHAIPTQEHSDRAIPTSKPSHTVQPVSIQSSRSSMLVGISIGASATITVAGLIYAGVRLGRRSRT